MLNQNGNEVIGTELSNDKSKITKAIPYVSTLCSQFQEPQADFAPGVFVYFDGKAEEDAALLLRCWQCGWRWIIPMFPNLEEQNGRIVGEPFLLSRIEQILRHAEKLGLRIIWNVGPNLSGGMMRRYCQEHPEDAAQSLLRKTATCTEGKVAHFNLLPLGKTLSFCAVDVDSMEILNLTALLDRAEKGILSWQVPPGNWELQQYVSFTEKDEPRLNYLSYKACKGYFQMLCKPLFGQFSSYVGKVIAGLYACDIGFDGLPGRRMWDVHLDEIFEQEFHCSPSGMYPSLFQSENHLNAQHKQMLFHCRAKMLSDGCFRALADLAKELGIFVTAALREPKLPAPSTVSGDAMLPFSTGVEPASELAFAYGYGMNGLKPAVDAAQNFGASRVFCRVFRDFYGGTEEEYIRERQNALARGIRFLLDDGLWESSEQKDLYQRLGKPILARQNERASRLQAVLRLASPLTDTAILYPICSLHSQSFLSDSSERQMPFPLTPASADYISVLNVFLNFCGHDLTLIYPDLLGKQSRIANGKLAVQLGEHTEEFGILILPGSCLLSLKILRVLRDFFQSGGVIIATDALPGEPTLLDQDSRLEFDSLFAEIFGSVARKKSYFFNYSENHAPSGGGSAYFIPSSQMAADGSDVLPARILSEVLEERIAYPFDLLMTHMPRIANSSLLGLYMPQYAHVNLLGGPGGFFNYRHLHYEETELYVFSNTTARAYESPLWLRGVFSTVELWNPDNGDIQKIRFRVQRLRHRFYTCVDFLLSPGECRIIVATGPKEEQDGISNEYDMT